MISILRQIRRKKLLQNRIFIPLGSLLHIDGIRGEQFLTRNFPLVAHNILTESRAPRYIGTNNNFTWSIVQRVRKKKLIRTYFAQNIFCVSCIKDIDLKTPDPKFCLLLNKDVLKVLISYFYQFCFRLLRYLISVVFKTCKTTCKPCFYTEYKKSNFIDCRL